MFWGNSEALALLGRRRVVWMVGGREVGHATTSLDEGLHHLQSARLRSIRLVLDGDLCSPVWVPRMPGLADARESRLAAQAWLDRSGKGPCRVALPPWRDGEQLVGCVSLDEWRMIDSTLGQALVSARPWWSRMAGDDTSAWIAADGGGVWAVFSASPGRSCRVDSHPHLLTAHAAAAWWRRQQSIGADLPERMAWLRSGAADEPPLPGQGVDWRELAITPERRLPWQGLGNGRVPQGYELVDRPLATDTWRFGIAALAMVTSLGWAFSTWVDRYGLRSSQTGGLAASEVIPANPAASLERPVGVGDARTLDDPFMAMALSALEGCHPELARMQEVQILVGKGSVTATLRLAMAAPTKPWLDCLNSQSGAIHWRLERVEFDASGGSRSQLVAVSGRGRAR